MTTHTSNTLSNFYAQSTYQQLSSTAGRVEFATRYFLGKPYLVGPHGEGVNGIFDQSPLYRFDGFDCVTFVNTVLALALSFDLSSFEKKLLELNYYNATPTYENRFHFMSADWNPQNQKNNTVIDITKNIVNLNQKMGAVFAEGEIDRPNWFLNRTKNDIKLNHPITDDEMNALVKQLHNLSMVVKKEFVSLPYLPLSVLFDKNGDATPFLFKQIPDGCVIEIIRPNWNLADKIGTNLHVSHVGFGILQADGELYFRHASSDNQCVTEIKLSDYLKNYLDSATIKGINIQAINERG